jgi:hypothetical protein
VLERVTGPRGVKKCTASKALHPLWALAGACNVVRYRSGQVHLMLDLLAHEHELASHVYDVQIPMYPIRGECDRSIKASVGRARMPHNSVQEDHWPPIPCTGHKANLERSQAFARAL